ncbi:D(1) dopamine receptor-like [Saccoglossus kowalevskii]|uniref:Dopamine receptor 2-like n=1 Tax=Saccoglossus kowalevskii TaxID=10224 RepID=A0ABM0M5P6_SACKO|nr:PREDICTED: dopamine receptor 2-like [Saccoglossus kowalevskii]
MPSENSTITLFEKEDILSSKLLLGISISIIILFTILGNFLVFLVVVMNKKLQTRTNCFIVSLAVADFCVGMLVMPPALVLELTEGYWPWSQNVCSVWIALDIMNSTASILNLCVVGVDRLFAITSPFSYDTKRSAVRTTCMITGVWICSALLSFVPVFLGWNSPGDYKIPLAHQCTFTLSLAYAVTSSCVSFYVPLLVMLCTYVSIFRAAQRQSRQVSDLDASNFRNGVNIVNVNSADDFSQAYRRKLTVILARERKAFKSLGIIMGVFVICWLPFFICNVTDPLCHGCVPPMVFSIFTWLGWVNSIFNPIIYAYLNRDFRRAAKMLLTGRRCRRHVTDHDMATDLETYALSKAATAKQQ